MDIAAKVWHEVLLESVARKTPLRWMD
jgi:hypothetical protein